MGAKNNMAVSVTKMADTIKFLRKWEGVKAAVSWKPFSMAAYKLTKGLKDHACYPSLVVDVGANKGQFSRAIRETFGSDVTIIGFEPLRSMYTFLLQNFENDKNAQFRCCAIGHEDALVRMNVNSFAQSSSLLHLSENHLSAFPKAKEIGTEMVQMARLDDVLTDLVWTDQSLLKIDVQGYELNVLNGAPRTLAKFDHVLVEVGLVPLYANEPSFDMVNARLVAAGLKFVAPLATLRDDAKGTPIQIDALYKRGL